MKKVNSKDVLFTTIDVVKQTLFHLHNTFYLSVFGLGLGFLALGQDWFRIRTTFLSNYGESDIVFLNSEGGAFLIVGLVGLTMSLITKDIGRKIIENSNKNTADIIAILKSIDQKLSDIKTSGT